MNQIGGNNNFYIDENNFINFNNNILYLNYENINEITNFDVKKI